MNEKEGEEDGGARISNADGDHKVIDSERHTKRCDHFGSQSKKTKKKKKRHLVFRRIKRSRHDTKRTSSLELREREREKGEEEDEEEAKK